MIYVGIDDTDVEGSRGTNQLARLLVSAFVTDCRCLRITRHQLLDDPRVPCTTKNGSASIMLEPLRSFDLDDWAAQVQDYLLSLFIEGSDPGLCVTSRIPGSVVDFGYRCKTEFVMQDEARAIARRHGIYLNGLGGTQDGVIGALAAVGLAALGDDGRIVQLADWPDDMSGAQPISSLHRRGVTVRVLATGQDITTGLVDVGKRLRPNRRNGLDVLFVEEPEGLHQPITRAVKLP